MKIDKKLIKELAGYLDEFNLTELEYGNNDTKIKVSKASGLKTQTVEVLNNSIQSDNKNNRISSGNEVKSPIIGTAYLAPEPGGKKFTEVGKENKKRRDCNDSRSYENYESCSLTLRWNCKRDLC